MRIAVHAVGRMKSGPDKELAERYFDRFSKSGPALGLEFSGVAEIAESRAQTAGERRREEAQRLQAQLGPGTSLILLDERGKSLSSEEFARKIGSMRDDGRRDLVIAIGGADGHEASLREQAALVLSFGAMTWPHQLVRIMLAEQLYRAATILSGHPYHRA
ncbi:23S rRNA (pseudouridine(1915)-N(3))-methyltransferase RlmH [Mesorhizobium sp. WSM2239]|jgi:23S rRNA (pseudouridine1915-N3)-methyltransferase|uniref:Ribosomal RNA large subunit methyltransferase H n=2 Tax=unclassified Mesorhizobium TaxID=325217 RepID=A0AAU8DCD9_9HYPH